MTIRAKLYAAIALTVIGPLVTIAVALQGQADLGDRFDDVQERARHERRQAQATERAFDDARDDARKRLIAVALGAGLVIVLLLVTAWDVARLALERERR
jgi:hypothetical protein